MSTRHSMHALSVEVNFTNHSSGLGKLFRVAILAVHSKHCSGAMNHAEHVLSIEDLLMLPWNLSKD